MSKLTWEELTSRYCVNKCTVMQFAMVCELFRLAQKAQQEYAIEAEQRQGRRGLRKAKLGYSQQWYFFGVAAFWMYLRYSRIVNTPELCTVQNTGSPEFAGCLVF